MTSLRALTTAVLLLTSYPAESATHASASLALETPEGHPRTLAELRSRIVVVNFWATWCIPCREEMPLLGRLHREYADRGVEFVGASADDETTRSKIPAVIDETGVEFEIWVGATTAHMHELAVGDALPATAIVDRDGAIAFRLLGPVTEHELRERLDWLLGDRDGAMPVAMLDTFDALAAAGDHDHEHDHDHGDEHGDEREHDHDHGHDHEAEEDHQHGSLSLEGASLVPS